VKRWNRGSANEGIKGGSNGHAKAFIVTIDPTGLYTLGISIFTTTDMAYGMFFKNFPEGMEWMSPSGRVRIMRGKLKYTRNKALYNLPVIERI
jgi:hypothetical protein